MFKERKRIACILSAAVLLSSMQIPVLAAPEVNSDVIIEDSTESPVDDEINVEEAEGSVKSESFGNPVSVNDSGDESPCEKGNEEKPQFNSAGINNVRNLRNSGTTLLTSSGVQTDGNFRYAVNDDGTATVKGLATGVTPSGDLNIPSSLGGHIVTSIGLSAFEHCRGFTGSLTIPNSITTIGWGAFSGCSGFTGSLTIPNSVTTIETFAFSGCSGFTGSLTIPNSVTKIGNSAFESCKGFTGSLTIGNNVTTIGNEAFSGCSGFTGSLIIPNSVTTIGKHAFDNCYGFTGSLTIGNRLSTIGDYAFYRCRRFEGGLTLGNSVTTIGEHAFNGCHFEGKLIIPNSVTTIRNCAFILCGFTGDLIIPDNVERIGSSAFKGCGFTGNLTIPKSVTSIGVGPFEGCGGFTSVNNKSSISIILSYLSSSHIWYDEITGKKCDSIANGIALREDYKKEEKKDQEYPELAQDDVVRMMNELVAVPDVGEASLSGAFEVADIDVLDKYSFGFNNIPFFDNVSFDYDVPNKSVRILIGPSVWSEKDSDLISAYCKRFRKGDYTLNAKFSELLNRVPGNKGTLGLDGNVKVLGYLDVQLAYDSSYVSPGNTEGHWMFSRVNEGGIIVVGDVSVEHSQPIPAAPVVYIEIGAEGKGKAQLKFPFNEEKQCLDLEMGLSLEPALRGAVGVGVNRVAGVEGGLRGSLKGEATIIPWKSWEENAEAYASLSAYIKMCVVGYTFFGAEKTLVKEKIFPLNKGKSKAKSVLQTASLLSGNPVNPGDYSYNLSGVTITDIGNGKRLLTYLDNSVPGYGNRVKLMYRIYNGTSWSDAEVVDTVTYTDSMAEISVVDGTPYILYGATTAELTNVTGIDDVLTSLSLYAKPLQNTSFGDRITVGESGKLRYAYTICSINNKPYAVWAQNAGNSLSREHGNTSIYKKDLTTAADAEVVDTIRGNNGFAVIGNNSNDLNYAYIEGDDTLIVNGNRVALPDDTNNIYSASFSGDKLYLVSNHGLYCCDGDNVSDKNISTGGNYKVIGDYVYYIKGDGLRSEIYRSRIGSNNEPSKITDDGGSIVGFDVIGGASVNDDVVAYNYQEIDENAANPYGQSTIKICNNTARKSVSIDRIGYDVVDFKPGNENTVYLTLINDGTTDLTNVTVTAKWNNQTIHNGIVKSNMEAGDKEEVSVGIDFPAGYDGTDVRFIITASEALDDTVDRTFAFDFSEVDLEMSSVSMQRIYVRNKSNDTAENVIISLYDSYEDDANLIRKTQAAQLAGGGSLSEVITDADWANASLERASGFKAIYVNVSSSSKEYAVGDNSAVLRKQFSFCDHSYTTRVIEPSRNSRGYTLHTCSKCGATFASDYVNYNADNPNKGEKTSKENKLSQVEQTLSKISSESYTVGSDTYTVSWNSFVQYDGRKHNGVGTDASGNPVGAKETGSKACDIKLSITKNGELVDPSKYKVKVKNNKNASVSIDGITPIQTNPKKLPTFKLKFKGKEYKDANKAVKNESFEIGIIPAELKQELITFDKVKTGKDGSLEIKKMTFNPELKAGSVTPKTVKMKWNKKENKTDFITESNADGTVKVIGKNNYYGSVIYGK